MNKETKTCQNCNAQFRIEPEDFVFYEKIKVPPPTWCPECRMVRRLSWINTRTLYQRFLTNSDKKVISMYSSDKAFTIVEDKKWWSDKQDQFESGRHYDFSKPFFVQFLELMKNTSLPHLQRNYSTMINSEYCNAASEMTLRAAELR